MYLGSRFERAQPLSVRTLAFRPEEKITCQQGRVLTEGGLLPQGSWGAERDGNGPRLDPSPIYHKAQSPTTSQRCRYVDPLLASLILNLEWVT